MEEKKGEFVFMDVSIDGDVKERMVFQLFPKFAPNAAENFRALCTGEKGIGCKSEKPLHYKSSFFHFINDSMVQGGDFITRDGSEGESIYGENFPDELSLFRHDERGLLSMSKADRCTRGSQFIITLKANKDLDGNFVVFGKLVKGDEVLYKIQSVVCENGRPTVTVKIIDCGQCDGIDEKKVRRHKRRKRRQYSSESESLSDSDYEKKVRRQKKEEKTIFF